MNTLYEHGETVIRFQRPGFDLLKDYEIPECDFVVNFISESLVAESWEDPERWMRTNVLASTKLLSKIPKGSVFIHVSTPEVYGSNTHWIKERRDYLPTTPYAVSRASFDMLLNAYWHAKKFPMMITRTANIYGRGQQDYRLIPKAFRLFKNGEKFPIHGNGKSSRSFIHVTDACRALYKLSTHGSLGETYHISTQKTHSILEVVRMISKRLGKGEVEFKMDRLGKDHAYLLNSDKMRSLGWYDQITLEEGLKDYADSVAVDLGSGTVSEDPRKALQSAH